MGRLCFLIETARWLGYTVPGIAPLMGRLGHLVLTLRWYPGRPGSPGRRDQLSRQPSSWVITLSTSPIIATKGVVTMACSIIDPSHAERRIVFRDSSLWRIGGLQAR